MSLAGALIAAAVAPSSSRAEDPLLLARILETAADYRVRARAAGRLGDTRNHAYLPNLERALGDPHPTVRAAVVAALGRLGAARAIGLLEAMLSDRSASVRMQAQRALDVLRRGAAVWHPSSPPMIASRVVPAISERPLPLRGARYVVQMGEVRDRSHVSWDVSDRLRAELELQISRIRGAVAVPAGQRISGADQQEIVRRRLPRFRLDADLTRLERRVEGAERTVRCQVAVMVLTEPGGNLRGVLSGAANGRSEVRRSERQLVEETLTGAIGSAMSNAEEAFRRASP